MDEKDEEQKTEAGHEEGRAAGDADEVSAKKERKPKED